MINSFFSNLGPMGWTIFVLIIVAVIAIIAALIWTKVIRPNKFSYTTKSYLVRKEIKSQVLDLIKENKVDKYLENIIIRSDSVETYAIERLAISKKCVYIFSDALYYDVNEVTKDKGQYTCITKRRGNQFFPGDLLTFLKGAKLIKNKLLKNYEVCIIVPSVNKEFKPVELDNINFIKIEDIKEFINNYEKRKDLKKPNEKDLEKFEKIISYQKKRFFINKKNVYKKETKGFK